MKITVKGESLEWTLWVGPKERAAEFLERLVNNPEFKHTLPVTITIEEEG